MSKDINLPPLVNPMQPKLTIGGSKDGVSANIPVGKGTSIDVAVNGDAKIKDKDLNVNVTGVRVGVKGKGWGIWGEVNKPDRNPTTGMGKPSAAIGATVTLQSALLVDSGQCLSKNESIFNNKLEQA